MLYKNLIVYKDNIQKNSIIYKKNYDNICIYRNHLQSELVDFVKIMENYEKQKKECEKEKNDMINVNESLLNLKRDELKKLKDKLEQLNIDTQKQKVTMEQVMNKLRDYTDQNNDCMIKFEKNECEHDYKYGQLLKEYKALENQYNYYMDIDYKDRKKKFDEMDNNLYLKEKREAMIKLFEKKEKRKYLKKTLSHIKSHIQEIEEINQKFETEKEIIKLLGKRKAEEYKKRKNVKFRNDLSAINLRYHYTLSSI